MGHSLSRSSTYSNYSARIETNDGKTFLFNYHSLVEHILLLRKVINHPEMTRKGTELDYFIQAYSKKMTNNEMTTKEEQLAIPWQIEWIWHVHRLHPRNYLNDCQKQLSQGLVNKKTTQFMKKYQKEEKLKIEFSSIKSDYLFVPSIDLNEAVLRQKDFLDKFQKHYLYSYDLKKFERSRFDNLVQDYVSFIKLAETSRMIVPTFDIDLIWHTHMRYPAYYHEFSIGLCGFVLDHNDAIESHILSDAYQITADRWKQTYQSEYGKHIDRQHLQTSKYLSSCAMLHVPIPAPTNNRSMMVVACGGSVGVDDTCDGGGYGGYEGASSGGCTTTDSGGCDASGGDGDACGGCGGGCGGCGGGD